MRVGALKCESHTQRLSALLLLHSQEGMLWLATSARRSHTGQICCQAPEQGSPIQHGALDLQDWLHSGCVREAQQDGGEVHSCCAQQYAVPAAPAA